MLINQAHAQELGTAGEAATMDPTVFNLGLILVLFILFYFLMIRPQSKRMKETRAMLDSLKKGDTVLTAAGFIGTVSKIVDEREVEIELGKGLTVKAMRYSIQQKLDKSEAPKPAETKPAAKKAPAKKTAAKKTSSATKKAPAKKAAAKKPATKKAPAKKTAAKKTTAKKK